MAENEPVAAALRHTCDPHTAPPPPQVKVFVYLLVIANFLPDYFEPYDRRVSKEEESLQLVSWLDPRDKFVEVDLKPVCKHCYERLPDDMKRRLAKRERDSKEKKKKLIPMCL